MKQIKNLILIIVLIFMQTANAEKSNNILDKLGIMSNTNRPEIWQDQMGGFMSGGSIHARVPSSNLQLMTIDLPSLSMGCGGIDLFMGGFGYIDHVNLEGLMKKIGTSALNYTVMLTIKSLSPFVSDLLENLEAAARFINGQNVNSCMAGADLARGLLSQTQAGRQLICQAGASNEASAYFTRRVDCTSPETTEEANEKPEDGMLPTEYNLVWEALKKGAPGIDQAEKEFLMSLSGTVIASKKGDKVALENKNSLVKGDAKLLEALIFGAETDNYDVYKCNSPDNEDKCLNPTVTKASFDKSNAMMAKVRSLMDSIAEKVIKENEGENDEKLSDMESELATRTSVPIVKLISLNAGLKGHGISLAIEDYAEAVAFDYVVNFLESLIEFVYKSLGQLEHTQVEGGKIELFKKEVREVQKLLFTERIKAYERLNTLLSVKKRTQQIETMVLTNFAEYRGNG